MFDISTIAVEDTATLHLKNANGELMFADEARALPVQIILYGPGSPQWDAVESRATARAIKRREDNDGKVTPPSPEQRKAETAEDLATMTVRFVNFSYAPAGAAEGTELFRAVYSAPKLGFIVRQVDKFVSEWGNFTQRLPAA